MFRLSLWSWRRGQEDILYYTRRISFVVLALVRTSVGAHATAKRHIFATPPWSHQSWHHPVCCAVLLISELNVKSPSIPLPRRFYTKGVFRWPSGELKEESVCTPEVFHAGLLPHLVPCLPQMVGLEGSHVEDAALIHAASASPPLPWRKSNALTERGSILEAVTPRRSAFPDSRARCPLPC